MSLTVVRRDVWDPHGDNRPSVLVSRAFLDRESLDDGAIVEVMVDESDESSLTCYLIWGFREEPSTGECFITENLSRFLEVGDEEFNLRVEGVVEPDDLPEAEEVELSALMTGGLTMSMSSAPPNEQEDMDDEIIGEVNEEAIIYVGKRFDAERPAPDGRWDASRFVRSVRPGLVAKVVPGETRVIPY